jgi:hypothetical protein
MVLAGCLLIHLLQYFLAPSVCEGSLSLGPFSISIITLSSSSSNSTVIVPFFETVLEPVSEVEFRSLLCDNSSLILFPSSPESRRWSRRLLSAPSSLPTLINSEKGSCMLMEYLFLFLIAPSSSSAYTPGQDAAS